MGHIDSVAQNTDSPSTRGSPISSDVSSPVGRSTGTSFFFGVTVEEDQSDSPDTDTIGGTTSRNMLRRISSASRFVLFLVALKLI